MLKPKLFVSLPMRGYEIDDIRAEMEAVKNLLDSNYEEEFELIDTIDTEDAPDDIHHENYYLGKSIQKLATADLCAFHPLWKTAPGCIIEHMVCAMYDIPYLEIHGENLNTKDSE